MNRKKEKFAEYLFDEIGNIDDSIIASAMGAYHPKKRYNARRVSIVAIAAVLSLSLFVAIFVGTLNVTQDGEPSFPGVNNSDADNALDDNVSESPSGNGNADISDTVPTLTLDTRLESMRDTANAEKLGKGDIKYFDGYARLIWKYSDEEYYRVCKISSSQLQRLQELIKSNQGKLVSAAEESSVEGIWISLGDGKVISPCLLSSEGNVGYGSVFDYNAEVEPSEAVTGFICDIIG